MGSCPHCQCPHLFPNLILTTPSPCLETGLVQRPPHWSLAIFLGSDIGLYYWLRLLAIFFWMLDKGGGTIRQSKMYKYFSSSTNAQISTQNLLFRVSLISVFAFIFFLLSIAFHFFIGGISPRENFGGQISSPGIPTIFFRAVLRKPTKFFRREICLATKFPPW